MKELIRTPSGTLKVKTAELPQLPVVPLEPVETIIPEPHSPIVTSTNAPKLKPLPAKADKPKLPNEAYNFTKEKLLIAMQVQPIGTTFTTNQFATLIAPHVKKSVDPFNHDIWDFSLSYIRHLMRQLVKDGLVVETTDTSSKRIFYNYQLAPPQQK